MRGCVTRGSGSGWPPGDVPGGKKPHEPSDEAIRVSDKLLLVLSPSSLNSAWVKTAIRQARTIEIQEGQRKLFPLGLVDFETLRGWDGLDADSGQDLGVELREDFLPDFVRWTDPAAFEEGFGRLLRDLKAADSTAK